MRATYQFQNSPKLNSNWSESLEKDLLLPVHDSNPVVGVVGTENIVLAVEKTVTDPRSATKTLPLDNTGIILTCGYAPFLVEMLQIEIEDSDRFHEYSFPISPEYVACKVAGVDLQLDCCDRKLDSLLTLIVGFKPFTELWVAHPSGMVRKCGAHAIGRDFELRNEFLLKNYNFEETSGKKAVKLAIRALLEVGESGEKNIEVTLITREHGLKRLKQAGIDTIIAEIEAEKIEGEKAASEKEQKKEKTAAARKKKRKAMKVVKKTPPGEPLDADLAEMDAKHVEIAPLEGPEVDEIKAENATHTWISKYFFRKYPTREEKRAANAAKAAKKRAEERAEERRKTLEKLLVSFAAKSDDEIGYYCPYVAVPHVTTPLRCESKDDFVDSCMTGIQ